MRSPLAEAVKEMKLVAMKPAKRNRIHLVSLVFISIGLFAIFAIWLEAQLHFAAYNYAVFNSYYANGTFQILNPLRRIEALSTVHDPIFFFHGVLLPYILYPFYAFTATLPQFEMSLNVFSTLLYLVLCLGIFRIFTKNMKEAVAYTMIYLLLTSVAERTPVWILRPLYTKSNSLYGIRSAMPIVVCIFWMMSMQLRPLLGKVLLGVFMGLAILIGTEHGMAFGAAFSFVAFLDFFRAKGREGRLIAIRNYAEIMLAMVLTVVSFASLVSGGFQEGLVQLKYNLSVVPKEQFWYFGVFPNEFIFSWKQVLFSGAMVVNTTLCGVLFAIVYRKEEDRTRATVLATLILYGMLTIASNFGIKSHDYFAQVSRVNFIVITLFLGRWGKYFVTSHGQVNRNRALLYAITAGVVIMFFSQFPRIAPRQGVQGEFNENAWTLFERTPKLSDRWQKYLSDASPILSRSKDKEHITLWSTYASLLEYRLGIFQPSGTDYIIHALGPERWQHYMDSFAATKPEFVQTMRRHDFVYEEWLQNSHWDFYEQVLKWYDVAGMTAQSIFWKRREDPRPDQTFESIPFKMTGLEGTVNVPSGYRHFLVTIDYEVENSLRLVPFFGMMPRYLVEVEGSMMNYPMSVSPWLKQMRFPILAKEGQSELKLSAYVYYLFRMANFTKIKATLTPLPADDAVTAMLEYRCWSCIRPFDTYKKL